MGRTDRTDANRLRTVRQQHPSSCVVLLEVDADYLSVRPFRLTLNSSASRRISDRLQREPLSIGASELSAINDHHRGRDPLEAVLERVALA